MDTASNQDFVVGGVRLARPFAIRRLGHFGFNVDDVAECMEFYQSLMGFRISDPLDFGARLPEAKRAGLGSGVGYFLRHGTDHHSFVVFPRKVLQALVGKPPNPEVTINQITWQVGSLREVVNACAWFEKTGQRVARSGRDNPGSNWHVYPFDPDGHINELYYGIEQIGWDGLSKPGGLHLVQYRQPPELPHLSEWAEVQRAIAGKVSLDDGIRQTELRDESYDVNGVLLGRPFKVARVGPVRLFVADIDRALAFYRDRLGLKLTEEIVWNGHRCVFLRANTEHHSMALYAIALRAELELSAHTSCLSFGFQLGDYAQLLDAIEFLRDHKVEVKKLPPELFPGIDYSAFAIDPAGHAIQLYYYMEQVGWDGRPRPAAARRKIDNDRWPKTLEPLEDTYQGEVFMGPLG